MAPTVIEGTARLIEPVAVAYAAVALLAWIIGLAVLPYVAAAFSMLVMLSSLAASRGRLMLSEDGIRARFLFRTMSVSWDDVWQLSVEAGFIHRFVGLRRPDGRRVALPALRAPLFSRTPAFTAGVDVLERWSVGNSRTGVWVARPYRSRTVAYSIVSALVVLSTVVFDRPWYWLDAASVRQLPETCAVLSGESARSLGVSLPGVPAADQTAGLQYRYCQWSGSDSGLRITYVRFDRDGLINASGVASRQLLWVDNAVPPDTNMDDFRHEDLDIGDEGFRDTTTQFVKLVARKANVVVVVSYGPATDTSAAAMLVTQVGQDALAALTPR